jgi:nicotinamidase-related amidase
MIRRFLVIIDMQNDFISGSLRNKAAQAIVEPMTKRIKESDENEDILATIDKHGEDYLFTQEGQNLPIVHCITGSDGFAMNKEVVDAIDANKALHHAKRFRLFEKQNSFGSQALAEFLKDQYNMHKEDDLIGTFVGTCTGICVISNALLVKALAPEVQIKVDASLCACINTETHNTALDAMALCQIEILNRK